MAESRARVKDVKIRRKETQIFRNEIQAGRNKIQTRRNEIQIQNPSLSFAESSLINDLRRTSAHRPSRHFVTAKPGPKTTLPANATQDG
jgi:hypothetical protein